MVDAAIAGQNALPHSRQSIMHRSIYAICRQLPAVLALLATSPAFADGMVPQTTIVILDEADGEVAMNVTNTDSAPALLYTVVQDIPEDPDTVVIATPPVARVEPGQEQMVRFILQGPPLQTQRLKRVTFEGIGQASKGDGRAVVGIGVRQNLPLLLHPKGLARNNTPWTLLDWRAGDGQLTVRNDSPYVVRLSPQVTLLPSGTEVDLGRTYLLANESLAVPLPPVARDDRSLQLHPASVYGFAMDSYEAPLR